MKGSCVLSRCSEVLVPKRIRSGGKGSTLPGQHHPTHSARFFFLAHTE